MNKDLTKGTKVKIKFSDEIETVTLDDDFSVGFIGIKFITLKRDKGAPYTITYSKFRKILIN